MSTTNGEYIDERQTSFFVMQPEGISDGMAWRETFRRGECVLLRGAPERFGVIVEPGVEPDEWRVAFVDGERAVYLCEHLDTFVPTVQQLSAIQGMAESALLSRAA